MDTNESNYIEKPAFLPHYGGFWIRVCAYLFDLLVIAALNGLLIYPVFRLSGLEMGSGMFSSVNIATAAVFFAYFVLMTKFFGQTLGKMIFGLRVVAKDGERPGWITVLIRELAGRYIYTSITFFGLPFLAVLYVAAAFTPKKQAVHDLFADTTVVHERTVVKAETVKV
ncbi:RDD family protein [Jeotgalibacillus haloalkalitolerans]|uniref:RDD family protein n=1 Tax=Jeotgalibacillus haloalkalitolerans TaxID=3104292 RepID=A0ABU5KMI5_9BACL|nr:RDD family protein [Jeotgalibacillus sp. HH7-29]MDZ5712475.1 RDD family protein [Jeotgalibacillus sp. HH7-29]